MTTSQFFPQDLSLIQCTGWMVLNAGVSLYFFFPCFSTWPHVLLSVSASKPALKTRSTNSVISFLTVSLTSSTLCPRVVVHWKEMARICLRMQVELRNTERWGWSSIGTACVCPAGGLWACLCAVGSASRPLSLVPHSCARCPWGWHSSAPSLGTQAQSFCKLLICPESSQNCLQMLQSSISHHHQILFFPLKSCWVSCTGCILQAGPITCTRPPEFPEHCPFCVLNQEVMGITVILLWYTPPSPLPYFLPNPSVFLQQKYSQFLFLEEQSTASSVPKRGTAKEEN